MPKLKSFRSFTEERVNPVVLTFGRFQPPTLGHEKLINKVASLAKGNNFRIFASQTEDTKKNPLAYDDKVKFLRKMFPKVGRCIIEDTSVRTIFDALVQLSEQGFTRATVVVGEDRVEEFTRQLVKYNGVTAKHGLYEFKDGITIVSSGDRDPDSDGVEGVSATKMREAAADNLIEEFNKGLPKDFKGNSDLFNAVRVGLGLKEVRTQRPHVQLEPVSDAREKFVTGKLYSLEEEVIVTKTGDLGIIKELGPNYVVVETATDTKRMWITDVQKLK